MPPGTTPAITEDRVTGIKALLSVAIACAVVVLLFAVRSATTDREQYAVTLTVVGLVLLAVAGLALRALPARDVRARRLAIATGVLMILLAVPAVQIWVGIAMGIAGVGLLFVVFSKEVER
ncbi:MAG: hypothetical protein EON52_08980 [Actinomycetales bacterium]|nr:MAG: hypothetical protein EON52_08980 [Actinomycetales bacterium]